ncbi:MAG: phytanoyl-CoA dioxygenase family protein [Acidiferrobacterales bacterium]|nr:phytanoyl-CoA dioxygenase family protein [Acidiferrobacterales bacterium]
MFELSQKQKLEFEENGFLVVDKLIDEDTVEQLRESFDKLFRGEFETGITPDEVNWQEATGDPTRTRQICNGWKADRTIATVVTRADIGKAVATLGGWPGVRVMIDNVIWKPSQTRELAYHQDNAYLAWYTPSELLSCWIALDDTSREGGTLEFVRGSHKWHHSKPEGEFHAPEDYKKYMHLAAEREGVNPEIVHVEVPKGGGSFHHGWTWHGSGFNQSAHPRRSLVMHGMRSDAEYDPAHLSEGTGPIYSRYKRLGDNALDENFFPVTWREDGYRTPEIQKFLLQ